MAANAVSIARPLCYVRRTEYVAADGRRRMKSTRLALAFAVLAPLAACNSGPDVSATNATPGEVQEKLAAATGGGNELVVQPGRWEGTMTISGMEVPNLPAEARAQMKAQMGGDKPFVSCVTEEDVKQQKAFFTGDAEDKSCKYDRFNLSGGKLDAVMSCDRGGEGKATITMDGEYSADSYRMNVATQAKGAGPMGDMTMKMTVAARRVGACKGTQDEL